MESQKEALSTIAKRLIFGGMISIAGFGIPFKLLGHEPFKNIMDCHVMKGELGMGEGKQKPTQPKINREMSVQSVAKKYLDSLYYTKCGRMLTRILQYMQIKS